jgi:hypothetical protein
VEPYLYLAGGSYGMKVLDISIPDSIHEVGYYGIASMGGIFADDDYIYYGTLDNGFYIFAFTPTGIISEDPDGPGRIPKTFGLHQNFPNPFNPSTTISFDVPGISGEKRHASLAIYDLRGRRVRVLIDGILDGGNHKVVWDGRDNQGEQIASGVYLFRLRINDWISTRKMTILR